MYVCIWVDQTHYLTQIVICLHVHLEKRSCQLFYYCVHMARKTTSLCYVNFYVRCSVFHSGYVSLYVRCPVLDLPTGGCRVLCTCTADIVMQCSSCSDVHAASTQNRTPLLQKFILTFWESGTENRCGHWSSGWHRV